MKNDLKQTLRAAYGAMPDTALNRSMHTLSSLLEKEEAPVKHITRSMAIALCIMILMVGVAVAAGPSVYEALTAAYQQNTRYSTLEELSEKWEQVFEVPASKNGYGGGTLTITDTYYDGMRVFIAYRFSRDFIADYETVRNRGMIIPYDTKLENAYRYMPKDVADALTAKYEKEGEAWASLYGSYVGEQNILTQGEMLYNFTYSSSDRWFVNESEEIGYIDLEVPLEYRKDYADQIGIRLGISYTDQTIRFSEKEIGIRYSATKEDPVYMEEIIIAKTEKSSGAVETYELEQNFEKYSVRVELEANPVDLCARIAITRLNNEGSLMSYYVLTYIDQNDEEVQLVKQTVSRSYDGEPVNFTINMRKTEAMKAVVLKPYYPSGEDYCYLKKDEKLTITFK